VVAVLLSLDWLPLGPEKGPLWNTVFVAGLLGLPLSVAYGMQRAYPALLRWALDHKPAFLALPGCILLFGALAGIGFDALFGWLPRPVRTWGPVASLAHRFPGLGREFMPPLDEGSYLFMPTTMPHASIGEALDVLSKQDMAMQAIPEIDQVVGKLGRVESPLDPAPISMFETVILYHPEYLVDRGGRRLRFRFRSGDNDVFRDVEGRPLPAPDGEPYVVRGTFERDAGGRLMPDSRGVPFRLWRPPLDPALNEGRTAWAGITQPDDIWEEILRAAEMPGTTSAPRLQPIAARIVMLQSGLRAPLGVKVKGPDLETLERVGIEIERLLKEVPSVEPATVIADRIVGKPYLEIEIDRDAIARYGMHIRQVQDVIEVAIGGKTLTTTVEGRERYPVRVRYLRELRDQIETLSRVLVPAAGGAQIPLSQLAGIRYHRGPQMIRSEDTFLVGYVVFDKKPAYAEVDVVEQCQAFLQQKIAEGEFNLPEGVSYAFAGSYQNQVRAAKRLAVVVPLALFIIFLILYLQFRSTAIAFMVFSGILIAWSGGFLMIWGYGQEGFLDVSVMGANLRDLFQVQPVNLSVAVWVGFLALFGIASDDGVLMATVLNQQFAAGTPRTREEIRDAVVEGARRRIRPALMTSATTILALLPVLTSTGRGSDIMVPMAIPSFGGMTVALVTVFLVPTLYCARQEGRLKRALHPAEGS
jgi:Cu(I)/Ag(I) efflux system membrane protein CusA/SilA